MQKASISILKSQLSQYLAVVKGGEEVIVTERGRPIARLSPVDRAQTPMGRAAQLIREGRMRAPTHGRRAIGESRSQGTDPSGRSLDALLEERSRER